jgi:hypothetical protein
MKAVGRTAVAWLGALALLVVAAFAGAGLLSQRTARGVAQPGPTPVATAGPETIDLSEGARDDPDGQVGAVAGIRSQGASGVDSSLYIRGRQQVAAILLAQRARQKQQSKQSRALAGVGASTKTWTWLGPSDRGGRTRAFVIDPRNPQVMFAGGITGGVWKSTTGGSDWTPLTDTLSNIAVGVLRPDPSNPSVMYAGTGEGYYAALNWQRGDGILRTIDDGQTWNFLPSTQNPDFYYVDDIEVSAHDPNRIYAATSTGVWRSPDGGATWSKVLAGTTPVGCVDLAIRTDRTPDTLFVSCGGVQGSQGIFRSVDGGTTWELVVGGIDGKKVGWATLAIAASNQDVVYASVADLNEAALGLIRSQGGGGQGTWTIQNRGKASGGPDWLAYCEKNGFTNGGYANALGVDPTDPNRLWTGSIDMYRSEDGGATLTPAAYWWLDYEEDVTDGTPWIHADHHLVVFDPRYNGTTNKTVYFTNDGGIFKTDDDRTPLTNPSCDENQQTLALNQTSFVNLNHGYGVTQFVGGAVAPDGGQVVAGTQDNGSYAFEGGRPTDAWQKVYFGDGGNSAYDPATKTAFVSNFDFSFAKTQDFVHFRDAVRGIKDDGLFYPPLEMDPANGSTLWTGGRFVWRTDNAGDLWIKQSESLPGVVSAIAIAPGDSNRVYVGLNSGRIYRTTNGLSSPPTWTEVTGPLPPDMVGALAVDPTDPNTVYAGIKEFGVRHLWKSVDSGDTWLNVDGVVPDFPVNAIAVNPTNPAMVYAGTDMGVFESLDAGATWQVANENLATTIISRLVFAGASSRLYAFTFGRGAYSVDVGSAAPPVNDAIGSAADVTLPSFTDAINTRLGTSSSDDPAISCGAPDDPRQARSVWYRITPSAGGSLQISTAGSNYDTVVAVYSGGPGALTEVACDDDGVQPGGPSQLSVQVQPGNVYYLEVALSSDASTTQLGGSLQLSVSGA